MLQWFLDEQVEEEDTFRRNFMLAKAAGDDEWNLQDLDARLGSRSA
jgi:ferritin